MLRVMSKGEQQKLKDADYILTDGAAWFTVGLMSVRIHTTDEGVVADIYKNGEEYEALASCYAFNSEVA